MHSQFVPGPATSGYRAIGPMMTTPATTGFPGPGSYLLKSDCFGHPDIGGSWTASTSGMPVIGERLSDFMAGLTTDSAIPAPAFMVGIGEDSNTTTTQT